MDALISVIVPIYNVEKYINRCIESLLTQTYKNIEIILVDDGSPDKCPEICDYYAEIDTRVRVLHQKNKGLSEARNAGIEILQGDYVMFVDSDDFLDKNIIRELYLDIFENDADMSICRFLKFIDENEIQNANLNKKTQVSNSHEAISLLLLNHEICVAWGKLYKASIFDELRYPAGKYNEDMFLAHKVFHKANKIVLDERQFYYYNQDGASLTRSSFNYKKLDMVDATEEWLNFIIKNYPDMAVEARNKYLTTMLDTCTLLAKQKDTYGKEKYSEYCRIISKNYYKYIKSDSVRTNDKIKATFVKFNIYRLIVMLRNKY